MQFVIYKRTGSKPGHKLMIEEEDQNDLTTYNFEDDNELSNYPNITQVEGTRDRFSSRNWLTYHEGIMAPSYELVDKGEYKVVLSNDKFSQYELNGELGKIDGNWILRNGLNNRVLLWKPLSENDKFSCACDLTINDEGIEKIYVTDKFTQPMKIGDKGKFSGTMVATGIFTGHSGKRSVFTKKIVDKIYNKYKDNPGSIKVDNNHDGIITGVITSLDKMSSPVDRIVIEGTSSQPVDLNSGLSIDSRNELLWDEKLKAYMITDIEIFAVSVISGGKPACNICYVNNQEMI